MKKFKNLFIYSVILASAALYSCEGPMGPAGTNGTNGQDGIDGTNGTAVCQTCHSNDQRILVKQEEYNHSVHAMGENAAYANNSNAACAQCHVSQGFIDYLATGAAPTAKYAEALQPNCYTCHKVHTNFDESDLDLRTTAAVTLMQGGGTFDHGKGNLCANCHQARTISPMPTVGGADVTVTSTRWDGHHGPMANVFAGSGAYEILGSASYVPNVHANVTDACVTCHMSKSYGVYAGGHQMGLEYDAHGTPNKLFNSCSLCHAYGSSTEQTAFKLKVSTLQTDIQSKLDALQALLVTKGIYNTTTGLANTGTYTADVSGAYLDFAMVRDDKSLGVHNPGYVKALLSNAIEKLSAK